MLDEIRPAFDAFKYHVEVDQSQTDNSERIKSLRAKQKRLTEMYIDGAIDRDAYDARKASINAEISRLEPHRINDTKELETLLNQPWETLYNGLTDPQAKASFWRVMVKAVRWDGNQISIEFI